ncbi:hypothetical protein Acry_0689 [Acidiphilium cryptum JF-5]|uniref:Uncharacterized protein n=1 Tax=Acidiphilium cryptum (strain JF-5) TaxID=349163 RepID=A5FWC8_ACICJ|nr:hypothetical protein Acry_0689 [Acidiphilium cryptum JF-5]
MRERHVHHRLRRPGEGRVGLPDHAGRGLRGDRLGRHVGDAHAGMGDAGDTQQSGGRHGSDDGLFHCQSPELSGCPGLTTGPSHPRCAGCRPVGFIVLERSGNRFDNCRR